MSSHKEKKKVHYSSTTKGSHSHRTPRDRDSGIGSLSSSRASLGTNDAPYESDYYYNTADEQRQNLTAVQEALDAANERIRKLEHANAELDKLLKKAHEERREYKNDCGALTLENDELRKENKELRREREKGSPRLRGGSGTPPQAPSSSSNRPSSSSQQQQQQPRPARSSSTRRRDDERPSTSSSSSTQQPHVRTREPGEQRSSYKPPPAAPQPPPTSSSNPFKPTMARRGSVSYSPQYVLSSVAQDYVATTPRTVSTRPEELYPNDGAYHPYPL